MKDFANILEGAGIEKMGKRILHITKNSSKSTHLSLKMVKSPVPEKLQY